MKAKQLIEMALAEDIHPRLAEVCTRKLAAMGKAAEAKMVRYCNDINELHSYLRDRVFGKDAATQEFVRQCQAEVQ
jgi:hypothetical protein